MCVTDRYDMTLAVKVALNPYTTKLDSNTDLDWLIFYQTIPGFYVSAVGLQVF